MGYENLSSILSSKVLNNLKIINSFKEHQENLKNLNFEEDEQIKKMFLTNDENKKEK
jgi:hypothetical protein